jgi:uncharacterized membrane protein
MKMSRKLSPEERVGVHLRIGQEQREQIMRMAEREQRSANNMAKVLLGWALKNRPVDLPEEAGGTAE